MRFRVAACFACLGLSTAIAPSLHAAAATHVVVLGSAKVVPYSAAGDPSGAQPNESHLRVRPLLVDGKVKEWTTGEPHDITSRTFAVRRAVRINDALPGDKTERWVWQRGPWLLIDRMRGDITALHLPDYDPAVSDVVWFRDFAAYCGLSASGKQLYAVVDQVAARKPVLAKKLSEWTPSEERKPACSAPIWQREPLRVAFQPAGNSPQTYDLVGTSAVLVEDDDGDAPSAVTTSP